MAPWRLIPWCHGYFLKGSDYVTKNLVTGIFSVVIGLIYLLMTLQLPEPAMADPIGPIVFPMIIGLATVFCGGLLIFRDLKSKKREFIKIDFELNKGLYIKIAVTIVLGIIYGLVLEPVGYLISTFFFILIIMFVVNGFSRKIENLLVSLGFSILTYVIFFMILQLSLPRGLLAF